MRPWLVLLLAAQLALRSTPAAAARLSVAPDSACLDAGKLTALVERELGAPLGAAVPLRFVLSGTRQPRGSRSTPAPTFARSPRCVRSAASSPSALRRAIGRSCPRWSRRAGSSPSQGWNRWNAWVG
jgi:hypothetical protein